MDGPDRATQVASAHWEALSGDVEAIVAEYDERSFEAHALHPGDVTLLTGESGDREGLDVLLPGSEFETVFDLVDRGVTFDSSEVYSAREGSTVLLVLVLVDEREEVVLAYPAYYDLETGREVLSRARERGRFHSYLRRLSGDTVTFTHDDPSIFEPPAEE